MKHSKKSVRLASHVSPTRYNITVKPDLESFTFTGEEIIFVTLKKASDKIVLHAKELEIVTAECVVGKTDVWAGNISYNDKAETATLQFKKTIPKGKAKLKLVFRGILNDQMRGFYRSKYVHDGKEKFLATTQFEATDARRAFPCFDEPSHKAIFDVTMIVPDHHEAISNTVPSLIKEHEAGFKAVRFAPTPKMSTYLLAFISGEFDKIEGYTKRKGKNAVLVRVFTTPGKSHQGKFALDCAIKTLEFFEDYFSIPYPLPTLDLIAIPDFAASAMENWGAVTYREIALLIDEDHSSIAMRQRIAIVIAHELTHQWFGNLVTMEWWTHLWLNEGFAAFMEYLAVDALFPQWQIWQQYLYLDPGLAFEMDSLSNTHAIEIPVHHPNEINEIFDGISYQKGSSIIRMLQSYLGEKVFRDGLRYYLKKYAYKNAKTTHLWEALEKISKKPVRKIMNAWTSLPGHPLITVSEFRQDTKLAQSRFFTSRLERFKNKQSKIWPIPISYARLRGKRNLRQLLLESKTCMIANRKMEVLKLNLQETGFFRVDYPASWMEQFKKAISSGHLSQEDRFGLLRDSFALAESGQSPSALALSLLESYRDETDYTIWLQTLAGLRKIARLLENSKQKPILDQYARYILQKIVSKLGWKTRAGESHTHQLLRGVVLNSFASYGDSDTIKRGREFFAKHVSGKQLITPDFRHSVYKITAEAGRKKEFSQMTRLYKSSVNSEERARLAQSLASFPDPKLVEQSLTLAFSKYTRSQDAMFFVLSAWANPKSSVTTWKFLKSRWGEVLKRYAHGGHLLVRMIENAEVMYDDNFLSDFNKFFETHSAPGADRTIEQVKEKVASNIDWKTREQTKIENWLKDWAEKHK